MLREVVIIINTSNTATRFMLLYSGIHAKLSSLNFHETDLTHTKS